MERDQTDRLRFLFGQETPPADVADIEAAATWYQGRPGPDGAALDSLPLPSREDVEPAIEVVLGSATGLAYGALIIAVLDFLGRGAGDRLTTQIIDTLVDDLVEEGVLAYVGGDRLVHVPTLTDGIVLTHRLDESEVVLDVLSCVDTDLAAFAWHSEPHLPDGTEIEVLLGAPGDCEWLGPDGWLDGFEPGALVAVRLTRAGEASIVTVADPPSVADAGPLLSQIVKMFEAESGGDDAGAGDDEAELPFTFDDIVVALLAGDPECFSTARLPLSELCEAAGLQIRGGYVARGERAWQNQARFLRVARLYQGAAGDHDVASQALEVVGALTAGEPTREAARAALRHLLYPTVCDLVIGELANPDPDLAPEDLDGARRATAYLTSAAWRPEEKAVAHYVAGMVEERCGSVLAADAHFHLGVVEHESLGPLVDRAAWYASDRGDARTAARLWALLEEPDRDELATVERHALRGGVNLGRNEPCWCGSGRKFKACHQGEPALADLPDRVGWLCRKATGYLLRQGGQALEDLQELALARTVQPDEPASLAAALADPLVIDAAMTEEGWFERFLAERGPLLPADEALLAASWLLVERTVYEVLGVRPGVGLTLRDLRSGDVVEVRERSLSQQVVVGQVLCARAVPDGVTHQLIGGVFAVRPGTEAAVLDLCDQPDGFALCEYRRRLDAPPTLVTREGEPIVTCELTARVGDTTAAMRVLDTHYEREEDRWVELHPIDEDERILRATLTLEDDRLAVTTSSEPRMERVIATLRIELDDLVIESDERTPFRPEALARTVAGRSSRAAAAGSGPTGLAGAITDPDLREAVQSRFEQQWVDEPVPALGGLTPRQAAADPPAVRRSPV